MKRLFKCYALLFLCFQTSIAQEGFTKHTVSSGETLLSIAKKYHVTPYDLQKANPTIINGFSVDDVLLIPDSKIETPLLKSAADSIKSSVKSSSISYTVKKGDTKFSLSKRFGLTITALESQNPDIIDGLSVGDVLEIYPSTSVTTTTSNTAPATPSTVATTTPSTATTSLHTSKGKRHLVRSGETLYRIATNNGLTVDQLTHANSKILSRGLIAGQILWIPDPNQPHTDGQESYVVKNGDTKFGLSRRFNTSIRELERHNPHIKNMLEIGHVITMPSDGAPSLSVARVTPKEDQPVDPTPTPTKTQPQATTAKPTLTVAEPVRPAEDTPKVAETPAATPIADPTPTTPTKAPVEKNNDVAPIAAPTQPTVATTIDPDYLSYEIQANDTLYGLAQKAGMSISDFLVLNPQLKNAVIAGTFIKMPKVQVASQTPSQPISSPEVIRDFAVPVNLSKTANTSQFKKLLFFLPFSQQNYQNLEAHNSSFDAIPDDFERVHLEFYKGATIAIDSIRKMYLSLDVDILEAPSSLRASKITPLLEAGHVTDYDAIILPFYGAVEDDVAAFTADQNIPVISASTLPTQGTTSNLYNAVPSAEHQRKKVLDYMMTKNAHIIVLNDANRTESKAYISGYTSSADFINIKKNGSFSENELISKFKKNQLNFVVIDSERNSVFLNTTNVLLSELSNYNLQLAVLESALIPDEGTVSEKRFRILNMVFPSLIPARSTADSKQFLSSYQQKYNLLPSANVMLGFDITFDSLLRMVQQQGFEHSAINDITEYTQLKFDYEKTMSGSYSNEGIYILQYDSDANIRDAN